MAWALAAVFGAGLLIVVVMYLGEERQGHINEQYIKRVEADLKFERAAKAELLATNGNLGQELVRLRNRLAEWDEAQHKSVEPARSQEYPRVYSLWLTVQGSEYRAEEWEVHNDEELASFQREIVIHLEHHAQSAGSFGCWGFRVESKT